MSNNYKQIKTIEEQGKEVEALEALVISEIH